MILLDPNALPVIGHRGNRAYAPEETLPSLLEAVALGVDAIEFDVHTSLDGHVVLMHDPTLDRTTERSGLVSELPLRELESIDAGYRFTRDGGKTFPWRGRGAHIVSLDNVIDALPRDLPLIIEVKTARATEPLRAAIAKHNLASRVIVAGFDATIVAPLKGTGVALGASTRDVISCLPRTLLGLPVTPAFQALCIPPHHNGIPVPIAALVKSLRHAQTPTHIWTINNPDHATRLWRMGVNGIISDDPAAILAVRPHRSRL
jgi:glycerophosphoryl diester phosphodiesterase